jgi:glycosyltransferase involved in cell wall biosynthesis
VTARSYRAPAIWMSWHHSRRSQGLAHLLSLEMIALQLEAWTPLRHAFSFVWTCWQLLRRRPATIFIQHSFLLTLTIALYSSMRRGGPLIIVDIHTKALRRGLPGAAGKIFLRLRQWSFRRVRLVIVANSEMLPMAMQLGAPVLVMPDPLPRPTWPAVSAGPRTNYFVLVASYATDEPWEEFLAVAGEIDTTFYCTGKPTARVLRGNTLPPNVRLTGWLSEDAYWQLLSGATGVMSLTREEGCVQCGAAEALSVGRPVVLTGTEAQRAEFRDAAAYVNLDLGNLHPIINLIRRNIREFERAAVAFSGRREREVNDSLRKMQGILGEAV